MTTSLPEESDWPAMMFMSQEGSQAVLFYFQIKSLVNNGLPSHETAGTACSFIIVCGWRGPFSGQALMNLGLQHSFESGYGSRVILLEEQHAS